MRCLLIARWFIALASWRADRKLRALSRPHYQSFYQLGGSPEKIDYSALQFGLAFVVGLFAVGYFTFN